MVIPPEYLKEPAQNPLDTTSAPRMEPTPTTQPVMEPAPIQPAQPPVQPPVEPVEQPVEQAPPVEPESPRYNQVSVQDFAYLTKKQHPEYTDENEWPEFQGEHGDYNLVEAIVEQDPRALRRIKTDDYIQRGLKREQMETFEEMPWYDKMLVGTGKGMRDMVEGAKQIVPGLEADPEYEGDAELYEEYSKGSGTALVGEILGGTAITLPFTMGAGGLVSAAGAAPKLGTVIAKVAEKSPKIFKALKAIAPSIAAGATTGAVTYTPEDETKLTNALYGGLFGAGGQLATKIIAKGGAKLFNALKNKMSNASSQELVDLATKYDVPLSFSDIADAPISKKAEVLMENIPAIGTSGFRKKGAAKVTKAIKGVAEGYKEAAPSDDVGREIQKSISTKLTKAKETARKLYDKVEKLSGTKEIPAKKAKSAAKKILKEIDESDVPSSVRNKFQKIYNNLSEGDRTFKSLRRTRSDLKNIARKYSLAGDSQGERYANKLRSAIERDMNDITTDVVEVGTFSTGAKTASKKKAEEVFSTGTDIVPSTSRDIPLKLGSSNLPKVQSKELAKLGKQVSPQEFAEEAAEKTAKTQKVSFEDMELRKALEKADKFYKQKVVPFKTSRDIKSALRSDKPDEILNTFIKKGKIDRAKNFYNALDQKGQSAVRHGMIEDAVEKATLEGKKNLSPAKFAKALEDLKGARGVFFEGKQGKELGGFIKLMRAAERFGQYAENPPSGARLIPLAFASGAGYATTISPSAVIGAITATQATKTLLTSKLGRNLLLASSKIEVNSPKMQKLLERAYKHIKTGSAVASAKAGVDEKGK